MKKLNVIHFAALWALIFALFHLAWAFGGYIGLDAEPAGKAFQQNWFRIYNIIAFILCILAMLTARALIKNQRNTFVTLIGWACAVTLVLRGGLGLIKCVYLLTGGSHFTDAISFWDLWFCLGAILFFVSIWEHRKNVRIT